jgi:hypothetical protein
MDKVKTAAQVFELPKLLGIIQQVEYELRCADGCLYEGLLTAEGCRRGVCVRYRVRARSRDGRTWKVREFGRVNDWGGCIRQHVADALWELAGPHGMKRVVESAAPELLKYLAWHYDVKLHEDALQLVPLSAEAHRDAVASLKNVLAQAIKTVAGARAQWIISEKGHLDWDEYIKALEEELRQRFRTPP